MYYQATFACNLLPRILSRTCQCGNDEFGGVTRSIPHPFGTIIGGFPNAARIVLIVGISFRSNRSNSSWVMTGSGMLGTGFALGRGGEYRARSPVPLLEDDS